MLFLLCFDFELFGWLIWLHCYLLLMFVGFVVISVLVLFTSSFEFFIYIVGLMVCCVGICLIMFCISSVVLLV